MALSRSAPWRSFRWREYSPWVVAGAFTVSAPIHLAHPETFTPIVPHFLPLRTGLVYASGVAELICAIGLWRRDRWAGIAAAILLLVIWPANLQSAITSQGGHDLSSQVIGWVRFPLQVPLIWFALQSGKRPPVPQGRRSPTQAAFSFHSVNGPPH